MQPARSQECSVWLWCLLVLGGGHLKWACVCPRERSSGLFLCTRWKLTTYSNHGSVCVCVCVCAPMGVFINRRTVLCVWVFGIRQTLPHKNSGPAGCGTIPRDEGVPSVCLCLFKWLLYGECSVNAHAMKTS